MPKSDGPATSSTLLRQLWNPANNEDAWRIFLQRYQPLIYQWSRRAGLGPADAEEVSARVLGQLASALRTFVYDPGKRFRSWLRTVVENAVRSFWRELQRRPGIRGSGDSAVQDILAQTETRADVDELVQELDDSFAREQRRGRQIADRVRERVEPHTWQAFWRTAILEQSATEVAAQLRMTTAAVYVAKNRVGKMLRKEAAGAQEQARLAREG
jgi:RNA polymerase sigma-70 factor (ECF subfamily)